MFRHQTSLEVSLQELEEVIVRHVVKVELAEGDELTLLHFELVSVRVRAGELATATS